MPEIQAKRFPLLDFHRFSLSIAKKSLDRWGFLSISIFIYWLLQIVPTHGTDVILKGCEKLGAYKHHKKTWFLCFSRSLLITYLVTLIVEKWKSLEKVLNFGYKNLYEPCLSTQQ